METVVHDNSPLAGYLEGVADTPSSPPPRSPTSPVSFAPHGFPTQRRFSKLREKITPLSFKSESTPKPRAENRQSRGYSNKISDQLLGPSSGAVLDQFRYIIITSQLLNTRSSTHSYQPGRALQLKRSNSFGLATDRASHTINGLLGTGTIAFVVSWVTHHARNIAFRQDSLWRTLLVLLVYLTTAIMVYRLVRRQLLAYARKRLIALTTSFSSNGQFLDAVSSAAMLLVQEVELVSRGYRISTPLPPVSRLEERNQIKRCVRLRKNLKRTCTALLETYTQGYNRVGDFGIQLDFDRYCDVYEITRSDIEAVMDISHDSDDDDEVASLKSLQLALQRLCLARKIFLCALLALSAGRSTELSQWNVVTDSLHQLSLRSHSFASDLDSILCEENKPTTPPSMKDPPSPGHDRVRTQLRRFTTLSQGIRELQAKIYLLREDSDQALGSSDDVTEVGPRLLEQYDAFGADLRNLVQEWEDGRRALSTSIIKHENRVSMSPVGLSFSETTTPSSLDGRTARGGSPADALKILNGETPMPMTADSSDEELFEAIALPRARSTLTREERISQMREDRMQHALNREKADASRHMVQELEAVIRLRPPQPKGTRTSL